MTSDRSPLDVINDAEARSHRREKILNTPDGMTVHFVRHAQTSGSASPIEGCILVETGEGGLRRINGRELALLADLNPDFFRHRP